MVAMDDRLPGGTLRSAAVNPDRPWTSESQTRWRETGRTRGGPITPSAWETTAATQVSVANKQRLNSSWDRWSAENTKDLSENTRFKNTSKIQQALAAKLDATKQLQESLLQTLNSVDCEVAELDSNASQRIQNYIEQTEEKIDINTRRLELRQQRPSTELVDDAVHQQLVRMDKILRERLLQLVETRNNIRSNYKSLKDSKQWLEKDVDNKNKALDVDGKILGDDRETMMSGLPKKTLGSGALKMSIHPSTWQASTQNTIRVAKRRVLQSEALRANADNICNSVHQYQMTAGQQLELALMDKISKATTLRDAVQGQKAQVDAELAAAIGQDDSITRQIAAVEENMDKARQQYKYRCRRPDMEKVVDDVDRAMRQTLQELRMLHGKLMSSHATLRQTISKLGENCDKLQKNINEKCVAIQIDEDALRIDSHLALGSPSQSRYSRPVTRGSPAASLHQPSPESRPRSRAISHSSGGSSRQRASAVWTDPTAPVALAEGMTKAERFHAYLDQQQSPSRALSRSQSLRYRPTTPMRQRTASKARSAGSVSSVPELPSSLMGKLEYEGSKWK